MIEPVFARARRGPRRDQDAKAVASDRKQWRPPDRLAPAPPQPWLFVIARNSSFTYKGRAADVKQVARELGVRYVLEGSVPQSSNPNPMDDAGIRGMRVGH